MKGKDQPKGAGNQTSFRTRAPFNREARIAQAMNDEAGKCLGRCFKFVPFVPSSDPVPGHAARGGNRPSAWAIEGHDIRTTQCLGDERLTTMTQFLSDRP